jgi:hypothetical protein
MLSDMLKQSDVFPFCSGGITAGQFGAMRGI